ncbi:MAG: nuclear transport factor 2 family protein [Acidimicrobiia bacterium]|nr:nuclear transport factor 2 family protein [Acidimicrobiia bacterium]
MGDSLETRLAALEAKDEIRELRHRYHQCINEGDTTAIAALFTDDAELDFGYLGRTRGRQKIDQFFGALPDLLTFIKQFIHNHMVVLDGPDRATGVSYMEAKTVSEGRAYVVSGRYDDTYVRTPDGWRFARMDFEPYFSVPFDEGWAVERRLQMGYGED